MEFYYRVGGLVFRSDRELGSLRPIHPEPHDAEILCRPLEAPDGMVQVENLVRLHLHPGFAADADGFYLDWHEHGLYRVAQGRFIFYDEPAARSAFFEHFIINEVMAGIFFQRGYFLLHGSAVLLPDGTGVVCFGEPGAGKSTTLGMFVKHGGKVLTDEVVAISFDNGGRPLVWPFVPVLRLWNNAAVRLGYIREEDSRKKHEIDVQEGFAGHPVPLKAVFFIKKSDVATLEVLPSATHAEHLALISNFSLPPQVLTPELEIKRFTDAVAIIHACEVYRVTRNDASFEDMEAFVKTMLL